MANTKIPVELSSTPSIVDNGDATAITITSDEKIGIGTTSPSAQVQIQGDGELLRFDGTGGSARSIRFRGLSTSTPAFITVDGSFKLHCEDSGTHMEFHTADTERMRIDSNGLIGIGTTNPASNGGANAGLIHLHGGSVDWSVLHCTTPTTGNGAADGALIGVIADDVYITNYETGGEIFFGVNNSIRIKIDSSGNLVPRYDAGYAGHADLGTSSLRYEDAYVRDGVTTGSDKNEKENITESDLGLTFIKELNPVSYTWKNNSSNRTHYGLIAQDIETWLSDNDKNNTDFAALIKEDISEEEDGSNYRYGLRYAEFISPLIKAIQEQQAIIEDLQQQINEVKNGD